MYRAVIDTVSDVATNYGAFDIFVERAMVAESMVEALNRTLQNVVHCQIIFFQMLSLDLPDEFEKEIENTEVAK